MNLNALSALGNTPASSNQHDFLGNPAISDTLSFDQIRGIRQTFEQETLGLQETLGASQHQVMLVAMYEGTEKLLNKKVNNFQVMGYLESLKVAAKDLHNQGLSSADFRSNLLQQSRSSLSGMLGV